MNRIIQPVSLSGAVQIPPSKSLSHRAVLAAALAEGTSRVDNLIFSEDIEATCEAAQALGITVVTGADSVTVHREGPLKRPEGTVQCRESGSTLRFLIPFAGLVDGPVTFEGMGKLTTRPLDPYFDIFNTQGIDYTYAGSLPLTVNGRLKPGRFEMPGNISSQFITGLLYVLPLLEGDSEVHITTELESRDYVELTLDVLNRFGIRVENENDRVYRIPGNQKYLPGNYRVEGDYSQCAFWLAAGLMGNGLLLKGLEQETRQGDRRILDIAADMGGQFTWTAEGLKVEATETHGAVVDASQCPDLVPMVATLAAVSKGTTRIINAGRVRIKESDRLAAICTELNKLGAKVTEEPEGLVIEGVERLKGARVDGWNDHRIVMSLAVASAKCDGPIIIEGSEAVRKSYPHFFEDFKALGGVAVAE